MYMCSTVPGCSTGTVYMKHVYMKLHMTCIHVVVYSIKKSKKRKRNCF